jgi:hypothetical protein
MRNRERLAFRTGGFWRWMCCWRMYLSALQQSPILVVVAELASPKCQASVVYLCQPDHHTPSSFSVSLPAWPLFDSARPPRPSLAPGAKRQLKPASRSDAILSLPSVSARIRRVLTISRLVLIRGGGRPSAGSMQNGSRRKLLPSFRLGVHWCARRRHPVRLAGVAQLARHHFHGLQPAVPG